MARAISKISGCAIWLTPFMGFHRFAVLDVVFKLGAEVFGEAADGEYGGICQCANGTAGHVVAHAVEQFQIIGTAFAAGDAVHDAVEPARTFAAGRALAAGFFVVEIAQPL